MKLIIYGIIIGIGKIIPGVSGSLLAISLGIYEKAIHSITHFCDNKKENFLFLIKLCTGIFIGIIILSKIILYFITNHYFYSVSLFIGLILSTIIRQYKNIKINYKIILLTIIIVLLLTKLPNINLNNDIVFLIGGIIEIFSSLIPGISGTSIYLSLGIYNDILELITNAINIKYVLSNIIKYIYFTIGMFLSFITCTKLIDYMYQKHKEIFDNVILGLSIGSIIILLLLINYPNSIINLLIGIFLFFIGIFTGLII